MSPLTSFLVALSAALVVAVAALVVQRGRGRAASPGPPSPWEPPPDLTWDDVRRLIDEADPLTRLTFERSFAVPPEAPRLRVVPLGRAPAPPTSGVPVQGASTRLGESLQWEWDGRYRRLLEDILRRGGRGKDPPPD